MNYLFHLYLSDPSPAALVGSLMGDFVKGRLEDRFPEEIARAIHLHRRVDSFSATHPAVRRSRQRLDPAFGHYRGVLVDVYYDHFLARSWERCHAEPLAAFARRVYRALTEHAFLLPERMRPAAERMIAHDWLTSYRDEAVVSLVLERMAGRIGRPNPLALGGAELGRHYAGLAADCETFRRAALAFARTESGEK